MMPGWSVQMLVDRERELRVLVERRRVREHDGPVGHDEVVDLRDRASAGADPCPEPCLERPLARAG